MTDFAFLMPIFFLFGRMNGLKTLLSDCDTGWHIRTGEWILAHHGVPTHDIFSYSKPDGAWYAWEWLTDILWAFLNSHGGLATVATLGILLIAFTFTLLFRLVRRKSNALVAIVITMVAAVASSVHWLARPHLFTLVFLVLFYGALENVHDGKTRFHGVPYLVILPFATILWTNLHGGFFVGIIMIGTYGVGEALKLIFSPDLGDQRTAVLRRAEQYMLCSLACLAASLVNPYTWHLHKHVVEYLADPYQSQHIMEFLSVSFHHPLAIFFEGMLLLGALAAFSGISKGSYTEPLLLLMWAHAALLSTRNIPIFMIVAAPQAAAVVQLWLERLPELNVAEWLRRAGRKFNVVAASMTETDQIGRWHPISMAGALGVIALLYAPHPPEKFRPEFDPKSFPVAAVQKLHLDPSQRIFTFDQWGDYLIYRLYPQTKVFMDGRSDYYGSEFNQKYLDVITVNYGWEKTLARFGVDTILMPPGSPLTGALKESARWRVVYDDGVAVVFRSAAKAAGTTNSVTAGDGKGRDREITKTAESDRRITENKTKT
ncbi:MAG TPA: hypothetical protein VG456_24525 [Candidatus Sulfopaludibacter sp.]|nr:hypothetical protein [Candidatus Sulfopaludibacter sp.]